MCKTRTNEEIFQSIRETGFITERDLKLLKNRSNKEQKDLFDYDLLDEMDIRIEREQGKKGLLWLNKWKRSRKSPFGYRENDIIENATDEDFTFRGFYDAGRYGFKNFYPCYELNGMEYIPLAEPYVVG